MKTISTYCHDINGYVGVIMQSAVASRRVFEKILANKSAQELGISPAMLKALREVPDDMIRHTENLAKLVEDLHQKYQHLG